MNLTMSGMNFAVIILVACTNLSFSQGTKSNTLSVVTTMAGPGGRLFQILNGPKNSFGHLWQLATVSAKAQRTYVAIPSSGPMRSLPALGAIRAVSGRAGHMHSPIADPQFVNPSQHNFAVFQGLRF